MNQRLHTEQEESTRRRRTKRRSWQAELLQISSSRQTKLLRHKNQTSHGLSFTLISPPFSTQTRREKIKSSKPKYRRFRETPNKNSEKKDQKSMATKPTSSTLQKMTNISILTQKYPRELAQDTAFRSESWTKWRNGNRIMGADDLGIYFWKIKIGFFFSNSPIFCSINEYIVSWFPQEVKVEAWQALNRRGWWLWDGILHGHACIMHACDIYMNMSWLPYLTSSK